MTGDHGQTTYDGHAQQGTTTASGPAPGWYADPGAPEQLRYFDGAAWTHHVAPRPAPDPATALAPAPVAAPSSGTTCEHAAAPAYGATSGYAAAPAYGATSGYGAAPAYGSGPAWASAPTAASRNAGVVRVIVTVVLAFVVLSGLVGGVRGVMKGRAAAQAAPGPALTLSTVAPETVVGRSPSTRASAAEDRLTMLAQLRAVLGAIPGSSPAQMEIYGTGPKSTPARGLGIVMVAWTASSTPFGQDEFAEGFADGAVKASAGRTITTTAPDGGVVVCHDSVQQVGPTTVCVWARSGTGLVMLWEYDVPTDTVRQDLAGVVAQMTRR